MAGKSANQDFEQRVVALFKGLSLVTDPAKPMVLRKCGMWCPSLQSGGDVNEKDEY